jgi:hypothetical protein
MSSWAYKELLRSKVFHSWLGSKSLLFLRIGRRTGQRLFIPTAFLPIEDPPPRLLYCTIFRHNVIATAKHYVGDGGTFGGIDSGNTISSFEDLLRIHMQPYVEAIKKGVSTIMISYSSWNGVKMHVNRFLISRFLKQHLNFQVSLMGSFVQREK